MHTTARNTTKTTTASVNRFSPAFILFFLYKTLILPFLTTISGKERLCKFDPTCSQYAFITFKTYGIRKGFLYTIKRILSCQSFYRYG